MNQQKHGLCVCWFIYLYKLDLLMIYLPINDAWKCEYVKNKRWKEVHRTLGERSANFIFPERKLSWLKRYKYMF